MNERANLFYALWPDDAICSALAQLQSRVRGKLTRYQNLHLTLAFIGPQLQSKIPALQSLISDLNDSPISLEIDRLGYFKKNRIAWAGTHETPPPLMRLQSQLIKLLESEGFPFDRKDFIPHITLARRAEAPSDLPFEPFTWLVSRVVLAQSPLPGEKSGYKILASRQLRMNH